VLGLDDHADTAGLQLCVEPISDLFGESFLALGPAGEVLGDTGQLG
jgi:hypothetical protein